MPETKDGGVRFVAVDDNFELGFKETVHRGNDDVEGEDDKIILLSPPLEVMLQANLNRSGVGKGGGNNGFVIGDVEELRRSKPFILKGSYLSIGPPILVPRHYLQESG